MSNWNNAAGFDGSSASSTSSSANPSSPSRRPKKGGKRRRRLCYKESCTLCPSFGYEGSVALSCSRHRKEGMQNLTARRCQHVGCFTAANFGTPGDKPRFCLAHSTEDMVNRNKPRGGEGMGIIPSRSPWRSTKTTVSVYDGQKTNNKESRMLEAEAAADNRVANCPVSGGKSIIMRTVRSVPGDDGIIEGDACEPISPLSRGPGRSAVTSVMNSSPVPSMALTSRDHMSQKHSLFSMPGIIPMARWQSVSGPRGVRRNTSVAFSYRGDGQDGPSAGGPEGKSPGGIVGVASGGNGRRVCSGNVEEDNKWATVPREPYYHDGYIGAHRGETNDYQKYLSSNGRGVPGGIPDRRGGVNAPMKVSFAGDVGNSGDIMNGGEPSFVMDGLNSLDRGDQVDSDMGFQIGVTLEEILGVEPDDVKIDVFDSKESHEQEPLLGKCSNPSVTGSAMRSSAGLSLNGLLPTVDSMIGVGGIPGGVGFSLDSCRVNDGGGSGNTGDDGACLSQPQEGHQDSLGGRRSSLSPSPHRHG